MESRRAQALVYFAIVLPAVLLPVAGLAVDAAVLAARQSALSAATEAVALKLAGAIDAGALRSGAGWSAAPALEADAQAALIAVDGAAVLDRVTVSGVSVTVSAHDSVPAPALLLVPAPPGILRATATARLRHGLDAPR